MTEKLEDGGSYIGLEPIRAYVVDRQGECLEMRALAALNSAEIPALAANRRNCDMEIAFELAEVDVGSGAYLFLNELVSGDVFDIEVRIPTKTPKRFLVEYGGLVNFGGSPSYAPKTVVTVYRRRV